MVILIKNIGIIIRTFEENNKKFIGTREDLFNSFHKYNVNLIGIPINNDFEKIKKIIDMCDGVILSGGDNIIENDLLLVDFLYKNNIPTLGICLGMQIMNRYISKDNEKNILNHFNKHHYININEDSILYKIIGNKRILVNSRHKTGIKKSKLFINAISDDGIIEGIEDKNKSFFIGLEWHPESLNDTNTKKIFDYFINILK